MTDRAAIEGRCLPDAVCAVCDQRAANNANAPGIVLTVLGEVAICFVCIAHAWRNAFGEQLEAKPR